MIRVGLRIKHAVYICCFLLICMCAVSVHAVEEGITPLVSVKVYSEMSENSNVVANLIAGNTFQVTEKVSDDEGMVWYRIRTDFGVTGYVKADEMKQLNTDKQTLQQETPENIQNSELDSTDAKDLEDNDFGKSDSEEDVSKEDVSEDDIPDRSKDDEIDGEVIALAPLNLRSMPSANAERIGKIKQGTRLPCVQKLVNDAGESWYKVEYNGMEGYVIAKAVKFEKTQHSNGEKTESETEDTIDDADSEENSEIEDLSEEVLQKEVSAQEEQHSDPENETLTQFVFEVDEEPAAPNIHNQREIDWMLIVLITGGILCVIVIIIFLIKIRILRRK